MGTRTFTMERLNDAHKVIEWERELLRRERELLQREREILNGTLNQSHVQSVSPAVANKKEIANMIPEFNPSKLSSLSSNQWVRKTESIGSAYSLDGTTEAFPTSTNEADVHAELMRRKKRKEETYEEYFYEMVAIAKKVEISDQAVVRYIIVIKLLSDISLVV
ncbi:hypothetical protein QE152_g37138 [Popillia japonica]|uniref:Uncharacterized protein n=1 Tax=Popillia japonica TaxID=7064 RepID=A0AAW1IBI1_POPJA